jgi:dTDP-D-glucose 4,6-dehydratase
VYGESSATDDRKEEGMAMAPTNPYAASKAAAEFMVKAYRKSFGLPTIISRGNNVYGPKQYPEKLVPKFISLLGQGKECPLHGDGSNRRSFLHVQDVAEAFDIILRRGVPGETYNIGSDYEITNKEVLLLLLDMFGLRAREAELVRYVRDRAYNDFRYHISTWSLEALGWRQKIGFAEGMQLTKDWYLNHPDYWGNVTSALRAHPLRVGEDASANELSVKPDGSPNVSVMRKL